MDNAIGKGNLYSDEGKGMTQKILIIIFCLCFLFMGTKRIKTEQQVRYDYFQTFCLGYMVGKGKAYSEIVIEIEKDRKDLLAENNKLNLYGNNMARWVNLYFEKWSTNECARYRKFSKK
jgi:hypothetical protein